MARLFTAALSLSLLSGLQAQVMPVYSWENYAGTAGVAGSDDSSGLLARFYHPEGVAIDSAGNIYVADRGNHAIRKVSPRGGVITLAGRGGSAGFANGTGDDARFSNPRGIAVDGAGNLFVTDMLNQVIRKVTPSGEVSTFAGQPNSAGTADGTGSTARFSSPSGITIDAAGNLYVADYFNHNIRKITPNREVTTLAGLAGVSGGADGTGSAARFYNPTGIVGDAAGNLFVAEYGNHTIRKVTPAGVVTTVAGVAGQQGASDGTGSTARFYSPTGITLHGTTLYVSDNNNGAIRKITDGNVVTTLAGNPGTEGRNEGVGRDARFNNPFGVVVDADGFLYVSDRDNHTLRRVTPEGFAGTFAGTPGSEGTANSPDISPRFNHPTSLAIDAAGNLYVADRDNATVRKVTPGGQVSTVAGLAGQSGSTNGAGSAARFSLPTGIAVDPTGNLFVAENNAFTIRKIISTGVVSTFAGQTGESGSLDGTGGGARFNFPVDAASDGDGNVYVTDSGNAILRRISPTGAVVTITGAAGQADILDGQGMAARLEHPFAVTATAAGEIYFTEYMSHVIRHVSASGTVTTIAGQPGTSGLDDGTGAAARFLHPAGIAVDGEGNLFVADSNHTIRRINPNRGVRTVGGTAGTAGSDSGIREGARFSSPRGVVVDAGGNVFVSDFGNHRIVKGTPWVNPFAAWQGHHRLTGGADGDDDFDSVINLLEFAFATDPRSGGGGKAVAAGGEVVSRGTPSVGISGGAAHAVFSRRLDRVESGLIYTPQFSSDLATWNDAPPAAGIPLAADEEVEVVSLAFPATLPGGGVPRFFRLKVSQ